MAARHGRVARLPASPRDPAVLASPPGAARADAEFLPGREHVCRAELAGLGMALLSEPSLRERWYRGEAMKIVLGWLEGYPGDSWQDRWLLSGSDEQPRSWGPAGLTQRWRARLTTGLGVLIVLRAVRPGYSWLSGSRLLGVYDSYRQHNQAGPFAELARLAARDCFAEHEAEALNVLTRMVIVTGKTLQSIDVDDFAGYAAARRACGAKVASVPLAYELLRSAGGLGGAPPTWQQAQSRGQLTVAELVDRYPIACRPVRDVLVHYLTERSAALDYGSVANQAQMLASLFWADIEQHHPGIATLRLPPEVAHQWKQRVRVLPDGTPRLNFHAVLLVVRSLYLDLLQWSLEDLARWGQWAAPCPITEADVRGYGKATRRRHARMAERTRALVPVLPQLIAAAEQQLGQATRLLHAAGAVPPGGEFTSDGISYLRTGAPRRGPNPAAMLFVQPAGEPGKRFDVRIAEDTAFWTWAVTEVLRRSGVRIEELLELTHLSVRQHQAPTGEMIPLLQVSPSKTDTERVIPADPELVAVLARVIRRVKNSDGKVPLLSRYDIYERTWGPPMPYLFQRVSQRRLQVFSPSGSVTCSVGSPPPRASPISTGRRCGSPRTISAGSFPPRPSTAACPSTSPPGCSATSTSTPLRDMSRFIPNR